MHNNFAVPGLAASLLLLEELRVVCGVELVRVWLRRFFC